MGDPSSIDQATERRPSPGGRVVALSGALAAAAAVLYLTVLRHLGPVEGTPIEVNIVVLMLMFAVSEVLVVHLETGGEAHAVTFSEIPMVVALSLAAPTHLIAARLIGAGLVLTVQRRQSLRKLSFNLALLAIESSAAIIAYRVVLRDGDPIEPIGWAAAMGALVVAYVFGTVAVTGVITLYSGFPGWSHVRRVAMIGGFAGLANTCIGLGVTGALYQDARLAVLVSVVALVLYLVSRSYMALAQRHASLETLHSFTRTVGRSLDVDAVAITIVGSARDLLRAEHAEIVLFGEGEEPALLVTDSGGVVTRTTLDPNVARAEFQRILTDRRPAVLQIESGLPEWFREIKVKDAAAVPLHGDHGPVGMLLVANRLASVSTFERTELALFEMLANHASVAFDNGRLVARLNREVEERTYQALHDSLTDLPNRELLDLRLAEAVATAIRSDRGVAVLLLDLEGFKEVNDTLGHHTGDYVLREVAARLRAALDPRATLARFGGDEFVAVAEVASLVEASRLAEELIDALAPPFIHGEISLALGASIGVAMFPDHGSEPATLLQRADVAMYGAKAAHMGYDIYAADRDPFTSRRLALVGTLREAIGRDEIEVFYQPQVELSTGLTSVAEALVRWRHPELGLLVPGDFLAAVERTNIIQPLTRHVLQSALRAARDWHDHGHDIAVAVNLSARSLLDPALPGEVLDALIDMGLPAEKLTLELTENSVMTDSRRLMGVLSQLREMGVRLSIDDFGTGYSSLAHLRRIPVSEIKIDKSFVTGLTLDEQDAAIVRSTIELGHQFGLRVVAEGVESQDAIERLVDYGCDAIQGFVISRPRPIANFESWLDEHTVSRLPHL